MIQDEQTTRDGDHFPSGGYRLLGLEDVFRIHGPVHGLAELQRRSILPPRPTSDAEIAVEIMQSLGQLNPMVSVDYLELDH